jgi:uncharacterized protein
LPRFSLAHNVAEERQVDSVLTEAAEAGGTIVKETQEIFFGRHGFFADPDGFLWEVGWNPSFPMGLRTAASSCPTKHLIAEG